MNISKLTLSGWTEHGMAGRCQYGEPGCQARQGWLECGRLCWGRGQEENRERKPETGPGCEAVLHAQTPNFTPSSALHHA